MKAKKQLGQNFLTSVPARIKIVDAGKVVPGDMVVEIGPGTGFLTRELLDRGARVLAIEKDEDLIPLLNEKFAHEIHDGKLTLLKEDVLQFEPETYPELKNGYKLIANIPYYITGAIFEHFLARTLKPSTLVVLIQKEVAERIVKRDGKASILSLSIEAYGKPAFITKVSKGSFNPAPTVDSAVLAVYAIGNDNFINPYHEAMFFTLVKAGFQHKRKLLLSNLRNTLKVPSLPELFDSLSISHKARAEDLSLNAWLMLAKYLARKK